MKLIEGRYYETVSGIIVGPMAEYDAETTLLYFSSEGRELKALNCDGEEIGPWQKWEPNGKVYAGVPAEDGHVIIREVPAPLRLEDGKAYVTANGEIVTVKDEEYYFTSNKEWHYRCDGKCCFEGKDDHDKDWLNNRPGHDIVGLAPSSVETLTIKIDAKEAQEIIAEAARGFDASAHKLLSEMAGVQDELRAAKDAFNVLHFEKEQLAFQHGNQRETIRRRGAEIQRLDEEIAMKDAFLAEKDSRLKRSLDLVKSANDRNIALSKKNEALGIEVLRLSEANHKWKEVFISVSGRKLKGDNRLRRDRAKLKAERARSEALEERAKDAEEQLRMYNSGNTVARNAAILLGLIATAFAFGGFFF